MPSPPSTRPSDARGRRSSAFVRERHAPIDARGRPALSRSAGCVKTTTLEALVARSGLAAIALVTKRAEASFTEGRTLPPWQFVSAVLEATLRERLKFERSWIMRACKGARTLADVQRNVRREMDKAKGLSADVYMTLDHYLDIVIPQIERLPLGSVITPGPGLNIMDLAEYTTELQALVIRSVLEWVYESAPPASSAAAALPGTAITVTCRRTKSAAMAGSRLSRPSAERKSIATF
jgi:hypothetical protein